MPISLLPIKCKSESEISEKTVQWKMFWRNYEDPGKDV